ncbi:hypothetical protein RVIR1_05770 [Candidatus Rickettsiella viridis]|uniref:Uncharacterized protein n=1 Tax=Candidatus Rickettsiella viridis TaxID=676208 RepID=A0A2Z5UU70_9COXI|nr:hypothetical protein RVIR1_05770 [Candidatus Rickettsiella viridis]
MISNVRPDSVLPGCMETKRLASTAESIEGIILFLFYIKKIDYKDYLLNKN